MDVTELYDEIYDYMEYMAPFFTRHFLKMGRAYDMDDSPLAYVAWDKDSNELTFNLNVENVSQMNDDERLFIAMHETLHVILKHNKVELDDKLRQNMATDIIINDYLVDRGMKSVKGMLYGPQIIGEESLGMTIKEVYDLIPEQPTITCICLGGGGEGDGDQDGDSKNGINPDGTCGRQGDEIPESVLEQIAKGASEFSDLTDPDKSGLKTAGTGHDKEKEWLEEGRLKFKWLELLRTLRPDIAQGRGPLGRRATNWSRPHRKIAWQAPKVMLPAQRESNKQGDEEGLSKQAIVLAIDTSGSISQQTRSKFIRLAQSIPQEKIEVEAITFTTIYTKLDINKPTYRGGGTSFCPIEEFIRKEFIPKYGHYPKVVCVFTDGEADFSPHYYGYGSRGPNMRPTKEQLKNWHWFIQGGGWTMLPEADRKASGSWNKIDTYIES